MVRSIQLSGQRSQVEQSRRSLDLGLAISAVPSTGTRLSDKDRDRTCILFSALQNRWEPEAWLVVLTIQSDPYPTWMRGDGVLVGSFTRNMVTTSSIVNENDSHWERN